MDALDAIERLSDLHRRGLLTDEEFAAEKASLLDKISVSSAAPGLVRRQFGSTGSGRAAVGVGAVVLVVAVVMISYGRKHPDWTPFGSTVAEPRFTASVAKADQSGESALAEDAHEYNATLKCKSGSADYPVALCLLSGASGVGGSLKIETLRGTKVYTNNEFSTDFLSNEVTIPLGSEFTVFAQPNGSSNSVLRIEVKDENGRLVDQDEGTEFGPLVLSEP